MAPPWFSTKYPDFRDRSEREYLKFPRGRPDLRYNQIRVATVSDYKKPAPRVVLKDRNAVLPEFDAPEVMANRIASELSRAARDRQVFAEWRRSSDRRKFHPAGANAWPSNLYGAQAQVFSDRLSRSKSATIRFVANALPCIDRVVRREVLFAKKKAGRGYRKPHRTNWRSFIPC